MPQLKQRIWINIVISQRNKCKTQTVTLNESDFCYQLMYSATSTNHVSCDETNSWPTKITTLTIMITSQWKEKKTWIPFGNTNIDDILPWFCVNTSTQMHQTTVRSNHQYDHFFTWITTIHTNIFVTILLANITAASASSFITHFFNRHIFDAVLWIELCM